MAIPSFSRLLKDEDDKMVLNLDPGKNQYEANMKCYRQHIADKREDGARYPSVAIPFQLVIESRTKDFEKGIQQGMQIASERMALAIQNFITSQIKQRGWPIDTFQGANGNLCFGLTVYMLTENEMGLLEDCIMDKGVPEDGVS